MYNIFTLKDSTPIYAVQFLNTFGHFTNSIAAKFYEQMPMEMKTASCQASNWYFKVFVETDSQILFNPLVIKIQILSLDRLNPLNSSVVLI